MLDYCPRTLLWWILRHFGRSHCWKVIERFDQPSQVGRHLHSSTANPHRMDPRLLHRLQVQSGVGMTVTAEHFVLNKLQG